MTDHKKNSRDEASKWQDSNHCPFDCKQIMTIFHFIKQFFCEFFRFSCYSKLHRYVEQKDLKNFEN